MELGYIAYNGDGYGYDVLFGFGRGMTVKDGKVIPGRTSITILPKWGGTPLNEEEEKFLEEALAFSVNHPTWDGGPINSKSLKELR